MNHPTVEIELFNPYESIRPDRKLVTRDILILIKTLRAEGVEVIVKPNNDKPLEYLMQKGVSDFLTDPANLIIIYNAAVTVVTTIVTSWIQKLFSKKEESKNVFIINTTNKTIINAKNKKIQKSEIEDARSKRKKLVKDFEKCLKTPSPYPYLPWPILKNHKPIIVGWCRLAETDIGLEIVEGIITDQTFWRKMNQGKYKGFSYTGIANKATCNICNSKFENCNHLAGQTYDGVECLNYLYEADLIEVSMVKEPVNKEAIAKLRSEGLI